MANDDSWKVHEERTQELFCEMATEASLTLESNDPEIYDNHLDLLICLNAKYRKLYGKSLFAKLVSRRKASRPCESCPIERLGKTLQSGLTHVIKGVKTIQRSVSGEHVKVNEKRPENKLRVQDALERYYKLLEDPKTKPRFAITDACRGTEKVLHLGAYRSFESFRDAVAREIAYRHRRYGDRASDLTLRD